MSGRPAVVVEAKLILLGSTTELAVTPVKKGEGKEGDVSYLRSSVERFEQDEAARDELDLLRGEYRELEARLIERDNLVLELRFDVETAQAEQSGYSRRIRELEASN